jgi:3-methyladenine DNA glycosylase AlkD
VAAKKTTPEPSSQPAPSAGSLLKTLERLGTKKTKDSLTRYGIVAPNAFGVAMGAIQKLAKQTGKDHALAAALWKTEQYEARLLAAFVAEPERMTPAEMDRWARDFDNWAVCDTACMHLFDRTPHALARVTAWGKRREEFVKRAAFALLASVALHDRSMPDAAFRSFLSLIERESIDERNFVKKAVLWALRGVGGRSTALHDDAMALARRLGASEAPAARFIGKAALRELSSAAALRRLKAREAKRPARRSPRAGR